LLDEKSVSYRYREYTKEPLQQSEIREILRALAEHPTLIQRPIGRLAGRAVLGRPPERLLELVA
jgi:arsenate reductase-like glutaredoxin family protein